MSHLVNWPALPLIREQTLYPSQMGVPGSDTRAGLRSSVSGVVLYVDPNHPGATASADGTNPENPLSTVAAALTRCQPYRGDTISVMGNNAWGNAYGYGNIADGRLLAISEEVIVTIPGVRIVGVCPSAANGVVWTPASNGGTCITVRALDVLIEGFFFDEGAFTGCNAISAVWNGTTAWGDNLTVRNCVFSDTVDIGIQLDFSYYVNVYNCLFWDCDAYGIYNNAALNPAAFCDIHDNIFHDCATGAIKAQDLADSHVYRNSVYNTTAQSGAACTDLGFDFITGARNQVFDNYFSCALAAVFADMNSASPTDAWINCHTMTGDSITNP